ncbi:MAG: DUF6470 family protein [Desulfitobacteriia bacterium]
MIDLHISYQFGRIGLEINHACYDLKQVKPDLEIQQKPAELNLEITRPDIEIDYTAMLQSLGFGSFEFIGRNYTETVQNEYLLNLENSVRLNDRIGAIENQASIGEIIAQSVEPEEPEVEIVPIAPADIKYIPATLKLEIEPGERDSSFTFGKVSIENYVFPSVRCYLEQEPYLKIEAKGQIFDQKK